MRKYIMRRLLLFIPTMIGVSLAVFIVLRVMPGDVATIILAGPNGSASYSPEDVAELRHQLGLDRSLPVQYFDWMGDLIRGDLGTSIILSKPISGEIKRQLPVTLQLALMTIVVVSLIAIPIGIIAAVKQDTWTDYLLRGWAVMGLAMPSFFVGLVVILVLSRGFGWTPPLGFQHLWDDPAKGIQQLIFPALALGFSTSGLLLRMTRGQLLEVLREDYVRTARAKGLRENVIVMRHAVRNALLPVITIGGTLIGGLLGGTVVIETLFNIPGVGRGLIRAMLSRDLTMIQAYIMYFALVSLIVNLLVDLSYGMLDPRIRYD